MLQNIETRINYCLLQSLNEGDVWISSTDRTIAAEIANTLGR